MITERPTAIEPATEEGASVASPPLRDLRPWAVLAVSAPILIAQMIALRMGRAVHDPLFYSESSVIEIITSFAPAVAALLVLRSLWLIGSTPARPLRWVFGLLVLGLIYFAGEEASWGQHYLGFATPDGWREANYQGETNIHNLEQFRILDNLPRTMLSAAIIVSSVLWPLWAMARRIRLQPSQWLYWLMPTAACYPVAYLSLVPQLQKRMGLGLLFDPGETEEMYFAAFLLVFAISLLFRLRQWHASRAAE